MVTCPGCLGTGVHDCRDDDAWMGEHMSDLELRALRRRGGVHPVGIVPCTTCGETGLVTVETYEAIMAASQRIVADIVARIETEEAK